jgi:hypothetical protein
MQEEYVCAPISAYGVTTDLKRQCDAPDFPMWNSQFAALKRELMRSSRQSFAAQSLWQRTMRLTFLT